MRNSGGGHIMDVKLPNKVGDALGKIVHPSQATLFKVERLITSDALKLYEVKTFVLFAPMIEMSFTIIGHRGRLQSFSLVAAI